MSTRTINGNDFRKLLTGGMSNLRLNSAIVNDLNVFPIPDGDTGDNMFLTINGGVSALERSPSDSICEASATASRGMLMSARGNSGVILSQFFAGIASGFEDKTTADVSDAAHALREGVKSAYAAVITPTEGTILTVARESIEYASERIDENSTFESFIDDCLREMSASLQRTPELLDVLREAGVIDSGGAGLYYIADGASRVLNGENVEAPSDIPAAAHTLDTSKFTVDSVMEFGYCTEFILQLTHAKTDVSAFKLDDMIEFLNTLGDSIVAVQNDTVVKIHVHTLTPEKALEYAHQFGEFLTLKIENMTLQHHETTIENRFDASNEPKKKFGIVTVATGDGIKSTFTDLGADIIIDGGQGRNPSTEDFIDAFNKVNAEVIFVLPNNANIVMAAKQAAEIYDGADVRVIESRSIGDGYAALTMLDPDGDADEIEEGLTSAMDGVETGMVTRAVRTTSVDGVHINENDYIGFTDKHMICSCGTACETACALADKLGAAKQEFIICVYGADATDEDKTAFEKFMKKNYPRCELCEIDGGQEIYHFMLIFQ